MNQARYAIGIDLGTSNCSLAYIDLRLAQGRVESLPLPQLQSPGTLVRGRLLPSFFYYLTATEIAQGQLDPFSSQVQEEGSGFVVGELARERMTTQPGRVVHSAKSWLAHGGVDREALILPFGSDEIPMEQRFSPVEVSAAYLAHLKQAWDHAFAQEDPANAFTAQRIVITVPASFDEAAQALTRKAADLAGYPAGFRLLEEPQAAFYAWLEERAGGTASPLERLRESLPAIEERAQSVLVCDVGGGTTDFSLFRVAQPAAGHARPFIERIAVSDHLLLGGDNIDLALAHVLERAFKPDSDERLSRRQWDHLVPQARVLKERVLSTTGEDGELCHVALPGEGTGLFHSALTASLSRGAVLEMVLEGFFPLSAADDRSIERKGGLREIGLPYVADTAVSRHLAAFLDGRPVDAVLFAGGTLQPFLLQRRLLELLTRWRGKQPAHLALGDMNLAIAEGAARFAALPQGSPERIGGGYRHSVYLEVQGAAAAASPRLVCVLPQGFEEGKACELDAPVFELLVNRPVRFTAYVSNRRPGDVAGSVVALEQGGFHPLPSLHTTILFDDVASFNPRTAAERRIRVQLEAQVSELGVLQLRLVNRDAGGRWALEFNLRKPLNFVAPAVASAPADAAAVSAQTVAAALQRITLFFGKKQSMDPAHKVKALMRDLERTLGAERSAWNIALLRALWEPLQDGITRRSRSLDHENVWLYLAGFALRPGYGTDLDPWRMKQLWECFDLGLLHKKEKSAQSNWWMMWRRVAGGLSAEQQEQLFAAALLQVKRSAAEFVEGTRLLGSLERVALSRKQELAALLFELILSGKAARQAHVFWALARLLGRLPLYTAAESVIPARVVEAYFDKAAALDWKALGLQPLNAVFSAACRRTNVRELDIHDPVRARVIEKLQRSGATAAQIRVVQKHCEVSTDERNELFGEQLPAGLMLA